MGRGMDGFASGMGARMGEADSRWIGAGGVLDWFGARGVRVRGLTACAGCFCDCDGVFGENHFCGLFVLIVVDG